jgi:hypothetical protein
VRWCDYLVEKAGGKPVPMLQMDGQRERWASVLAERGEAGAVEAMEWTVSAGYSTPPRSASVFPRMSSEKKTKKTEGKAEGAKGRFQPRAFVFQRVENHAAHEPETAFGEEVFENKPNRKDEKQ